MCRRLKEAYGRVRRSADVGEGAAEVGGVGEGFGGHRGDGRAGEEGELQGAACDPGDGPLRFF